jgi:hypothetical protein
MKYNVHAHVQAIDEKTLQEITRRLTELQNLIAPFVTPLTPHERHILPKMGEKSLAFVEKCCEFSQNNPSIRPNYLDMGEFETDFKDAHGLFVAVNMAAQVLENLSDTQMCAGSEAFHASLLFYHSAKTAAANDVAGAKAVYEELRKRFPHRRRRESGNGVPPED